MSFVIDFLPAASPKHHQMNMASGPNLEEAAIANAGVVHDDATAGRYGNTSSRNVETHYPSGTTATGAGTNGWTNGHKESDPRSMI